MDYVERHMRHIRNFYHSLRTITGVDRINLDGLDLLVVEREGKNVIYHGPFGRAIVGRMSVRLEMNGPAQN